MREGRSTVHPGVHGLPRGEEALLHRVEGRDQRHAIHRLNGGFDLGREAISLDRNLPRRLRSESPRAHSLRAGEARHPPASLDAPRRSARSAALANGLRRRGARDRRRVVVPTSLGKIPPPFGDLLLSDPGICRLAPLSPGAFKWWHDVPLLRVLGHGDTAVASPLPVLRARNARHDRGEVAAISGCPPHRLSRSARRH